MLRRSAVAASLFLFPLMALAQTNMQVEFLGKATAKLERQRNDALNDVVNIQARLDIVLSQLQQAQVELQQANQKLREFEAARLIEQGLNLLKQE